MPDFKRFDKILRTPGEAHFSYTQRDSKRDICPMKLCSLFHQPPDAYDKNGGIYSVATNMFGLKR